MRNKKDSILITYASAGLGHKMAAGALKESFGSCGLNVDTVDVLDFADPFFRFTYSRMYEILGEYFHKACELTYRITDYSPEENMFVKLIRFLSEKNVSPFSDFVLENDSFCAVCTHFLPVDVFSSLKKEGLFKGKIFACITDYDLHRFWYNPDVDIYFAASHLVAEKLKELGVDEKSIVISGIPIRSRFIRAYKKAQEMAADRNQSKKELRVLLLASSISEGNLVDIIKGIESLMIPVRLTVAAGRNWNLKSKLDSIKNGSSIPLEPLGFVDNLDELMLDSDILITKPGGLIVSEALCTGIPMLFTSPIPLQETYNADYFKRKGVGILCETPSELISQIGALASDRAKINRMSASCLRMARPFAADTIVKKILSNSSSEAP